MTKRVKPVLNIPTVSTVEEADATLAEIAARKRRSACTRSPSRKTWTSSRRNAPPAASH